jgi:MFS transporter, DHA2 family, multidrug resistance protein
VSAAPPERAGAASGMSETFFELGGALGLSILGSIGVLIYRSEIADQLPASVPAGAAEAARDTLGAAVSAAQQLPADVGAELLAVARQSFVDGMHAAAAIGLVMAIVLIGWVLRSLSSVPPTGDAEAQAPDPEKVTQATFYCG